LYNDLFCYHSVHEVRAKAGDRVLTVYGTGIVLGVRDSDGVHIVNVKQVSGDMTAYLSPEGIIRQLPAIVGEYAHTSYGNAYLLGYRADDSVYFTRLPYGIGYIQPEEVQEAYVPDAGTAGISEDGQDCAVQ
jgi:primosomal protein N'